MDELYTSKGLIRTRINNNLIEVENEKPKHKNQFTNSEFNYVKTMLKYALESTETIPSARGVKPKTDAFDKMIDLSYYTKRKDLLRIAILLGTSRNKKAAKNAMDVIRYRIGTVTLSDYEYVTNLISNKNPVIVDEVNQYLCNNLRNFEHWHTMYFDKYYGV